MNVIVITSIVVVITLLIGALLAIIVRAFSRAVTNEQLAIEAEKNSINQSLTMGFDIPVNAEFADQLKVARELAARQAARMPRGSNLGIGKLGTENQPTAFDGVKSDPLTAVKIAHFHGWQLLHTGAKVDATPEAVAKKAPTRAAEPEKSADDLVPGVDYSFIEITEDMSPAEKRKARIANAKAKSAAMKAYKQAGSVVIQTTVAQEDTVPETQPEPIESAPPTEIPSDIPEPDIIEISDDMDPGELRKARIHNAKAKAAYKKALKEAGFDPDTVNI